MPITTLRPTLLIAAVPMLAEATDQGNRNQHLGPVSGFMNPNLGESIEKVIYEHVNLAFEELDTIQVLSTPHFLSHFIEGAII